MKLALPAVSTAPGQSPKEKNQSFDHEGETLMGISTRRGFFGKVAAMLAVMTGSARLFPQLSAPGISERNRQTPSADRHMQNGVYYFYGTGSNDGYSDHIGVTDPFEKHVTRTMDALKKDLEKHGCTMDSILQLQVFLCLPLADGVPMPTGKARFDAHKAQYEALNRIYRTYFSPGQMPARSCMALEWIPGDSLIEIVGAARVV